jgi:hypothetical protein
MKKSTKLIIGEVIIILFLLISWKSKMDNERSANLQASSNITNIENTNNYN